MKKIGFLLLMVFAMLSTYAQKDTKSKVIHDFLEQSEAKIEIEHLVRQKIYELKEKKPKVPEEVWENILRTFNFELFTQKMFMAYDASYTEEEMLELLDLSKQKKSEDFKKKNKKAELELVAIEKELYQILAKNLSGY